MRFPAVLLLAALGAGCGDGAPEKAARPLTVFAAASLADVLPRAAALCEAETGGPAVFAFAASSTLARQIEAGAPGDVFVSASADWMDRLEEKGLLAPATRRDLVGNSLVLITPADSTFTPAGFDGFDVAAALGPDGRLALGDPDHVPAGQYARAALQSLGLWDAAEPRLARAADARAALALVARGEAPLGIVYASDAAIEPRVRIAAAIPPERHSPIVYPAAALATGDEARAAAFLACLGTDGPMAAFRDAGFSSPPQPR